MDPNLVAISAHSVERIVAVVLGGLAVYYGYRLFLVVPLETHSDGKIRLPGLSVTLAKAGPGIFFAAFGAIVVITSLTRPIKVGGDAAYQGMTEAVSAAAHPIAVQPTGRSEQDVARVRLDLQTLNCMQRLSNKGPKTFSTDSDLAVRDAKLALLETVWTPSDWGDFETFKRWAFVGTSSTSGLAKELFEGQRSDCPR